MHFAIQASCPFGSVSPLHPSVLSVCVSLRLRIEDVQQPNITIVLDPKKGIVLIVSLQMTAAGKR